MFCFLASATKNGPPFADGKTPGPSKVAMQDAGAIQSGDGSWGQPSVTRQMSALCELRTLDGCQEQVLVDGFFCGRPLARTDCRDVLAEHEIQVVHCVNTIHHFPGPHKLSRLLDESMEYIFVQYGLQDLAN